MIAKLRKTRKTDVRITFAELWDHAQRAFGPDKFLYVSAPYGMCREEFLSQYARFIVILPAMPTRAELETGIFSPTGARMVKFWA